MHALGRTDDGVDIETAPDGAAVYSMTAGDIHLNPVRAGLIAPEKKLCEYRWSSYPLYARTRGKMPPRLFLGTVLGDLGLEDRAGDRWRYAERMEGRITEERKRSKARVEELKELRRGWCLGGVEFRQRALALIEGLKRSVEAEETDGQRSQAGAYRAGGRGLGP